MSSINFTLHQLQAFRAVAQYRSFSDAARAMFISQPSLTVLIQNLEQALDATLFSRTTRRVEITELGQELLPIVERVFSELDYARANLTDLGALRRGSVAIGALPSGSAGLVPKALYAFRQAHPEVRVSLKEGVASELIDLVRIGEVDFGFGSASPAPDIAFAPIARDSMHLVCRRDHRLASRREVEWAEIADEPFVAMIPGTSVRHATDTGFAKIRRVKKPDFEVRLLSSMFGLAQAGVGVTVLPTAVLQVFNVEGVATVPLVAPVVYRQLGFINRRGREPSPSAAALMAVITEEARREKSVASVLKASVARAARLKARGAGASRDIS